MAISGLGYLNQVNSTDKTRQSLIKQISTGSAYPSASYGPSDYAINVRLNSSIGVTEQSNRNTQTANSMLNVAAGGVSSTVEALSSLRSQILQAANGTNKDTDVAAIQKNVNQTIATIDDNASVEYNGKKLLDGSASITVAGVDGYKNVQLGNMTSHGLGLTDADGNSTLDLSSAEGIADALDKVDSALNTALDEATNIGAVQQNLSFASANYTTQSESLMSAESTSGDLDIAKAVTELSSANTQNKLAMFAQKLYMHNNASVLKLLQ
ncbi:flagellin [Schwartzia sp. (in: firmicutes)]